MGSPRWAAPAGLMGWIHLYTSLLLVPWMLVYAVSAFCLNHHDWVTKGFGLESKWTVVQKQKFTPDATFLQAFEAQAQALLKLLALEGPHRLAGTPDATS